MGVLPFPPGTSGGYFSVKKNSSCTPAVAVVTFNERLELAPCLDYLITTFVEIFFKNSISS